jgi:hypothetical protein
MSHDSVTLQDPGLPTGFKAGESLRAHAAITLLVPNSGVDWLDEMIREARERETARAVLQSIISSNGLAGGFLQAAKSKGMGVDAAMSSAAETAKDCAVGLLAALDKD